MRVFDKDLYFVAVKLFLLQDSKLLILKDNFGDWDLPGGRMKKDEFETPLEEILERKVREELGSKVQYTLSKPVLYMRHERVEQVQGSPVVRIFAVGFEGTLNGGEVVLSPRHTEMQWVDMATFQPEQYFTGGWLRGVQEFLSLKQGSDRG